MADRDNLKDTKDYHLDTPARNEAFFLKGAGALDWGMQNRLSRIFNPRSGRTVMLAIDHGYFLGPTSGLERIDVNIFRCCRTAMRSRSPEASCAPPSRPRSTTGS
jgi:3-hydroxy-5-phosphonooxypentane-2,4-dione thiolase